MSIIEQIKTIAEDTAKTITEKFDEYQGKAVETGNELKDKAVETGNELKDKVTNTVGIKATEAPVAEEKVVEEPAAEEKVVDITDEQTEEAQA